MSLVLALLLLSARLPPQIRPSPTHEQVKSTTPQEAPAKSKDRQQAKPVIPSQTPNTQSSHSGTTETQQTDKRSTANTDTVSAYSTLIIALFTLVTTGIFAYQVHITHNAERAWIIVTKAERPERLQWVNFPADTESIHFRFVFTNHGRTPAKINYVRIRFHILARLEDLPKSPTYGDGKHTVFQDIGEDGILIPSSEEFVALSTFEGLDGQNAPTVAQVNDVREHKSFLVSYGLIRYRDAFNRRHETRFCYVYDVRVDAAARPPINDWCLRGGPSAYNKAS
jgi:hypothetical protein